MKRSQIVFITVVFTALFTGILVERSHRFDPLEAFDFTTPRRIEFDPLETPAGSHGFRGIVLAADGTPAGGVLIHLRTAVDDSPEAIGTAEPLHWTHTLSDGTFELGELPAGEYIAALLAHDIPNSRHAVRIPMPALVRWTLPEPLPPMKTLERIERHDLSGRLVLAAATSHRESPGEPIDPPADLSGFEVVLIPATDTPPLTGALTRRLRVDATGQFQAKALVTASYRIQVMPAWARGGTWPVLAEFEYRHDGQAGVPELRVEAATLAGRVRDPARRPIEGAVIQVHPTAAPNHLWPPTNTDARGHFQVEDLPAGSYTVRVLAGAGIFEEVVELSTGEHFELAVDGLQTRPSR